MDLTPDIRYTNALFAKPDEAGQSHHQKPNPLASSTMQRRRCRLALSWISVPESRDARERLWVRDEIIQKSNARSTARKKVHHQILDRT